LRDKVELFPSSAETLAGVQDLSIDVALMVGVLEHVPDKAAVFKALKRVLKPQGCLICLTPNAGFCYYRWRERKHKPWRILSSDEFLDATQVSKWRRRPHKAPPVASPAQRLSSIERS
jgi:ubiquinone/menaquinone biosynthesis C-methylase UbiE